MSIFEFIIVIIIIIIIIVIITIIMIVLIIHKTNSSRYYYYTHLYMFKKVQVQFHISSSNSDIKFYNYAILQVYFLYIVLRPFLKSNRLSHLLTSRGRLSHSMAPL